MYLFGKTIEKVPWLMNLSEIMTEMGTGEILIGINLTVVHAVPTSESVFIWENY